MKVIIIDDEPLARSILKEYCDAEGLYVCAECSNGFEGVKAVQQEQPDLLLLDVQMPRISGFEMLELIDNPPPVIFTTAFDEYALRAFEAGAADYLLKPVSLERFRVAVERVRSRGGSTAAAETVARLARRPEESKRIVVRTNGEISIIPVADIAYMEAFDDYVKIFTADSWHLKKQTMNYYEEVLDGGQFFRAHRSFIINLKQLLRVEPLGRNSHEAVLAGGKRIPLSRPAYARLRERLGI